MTADGSQADGAAVGMTAGAAVGTIAGLRAFLTFHTA